MCLRHELHKLNGSLVLVQNHCVIVEKLTPDDVVEVDTLAESQDPPALTLVGLSDG